MQNKYGGVSIKNLAWSRTAKQAVKAEQSGFFFFSSVSKQQLITNHELKPLPAAFVRFSKRKTTLPIPAVPQKSLYLSYLCIHTFLEGLTVLAEGVKKNCIGILQSDKICLIHHLSMQTVKFNVQYNTRCWDT